MACEERNAEAWLARGIEAYQKQRFAEAAAQFEKAVGIDPESVQAHLALGAARLTLYKRPPSPVSTYRVVERDISDSELAAYREGEKAILAEKNSTNWPLAEKSLKRANQLEPENRLVVEYLCALYIDWKDPFDEKNDRVDEAKQWLERLVELQPDHWYANFICGMMLTAKAMKLLPNYGRWPPLPEPNLVSLRAKLSPTLDEASRHLERALALQGEQSGALQLIDEVKSMQAYLIDPETTARDLRDELTEDFGEHWQARTTEKQASGPALSSGPSATITFQLSPEALAEDRERPFPPNPWRIPRR